MKARTAMSDDWKDKLKEIGKRLQNGKADNENMIANLGYSFQAEDYYRQEKETTAKKDAERITDFTLDNRMQAIIKNRQKELEELAKVRGDKTDIGCFQVSVNYPGLVVGMSNPIMCSLKEKTDEQQSKNKENQKRYISAPVGMKDDQKSKDKENQDDAFKTGFSFDYVTGLPYIPGSSVKGMLRSSMVKYKEDVCEWIKDVTRVSRADMSFEKIIYEMFGSANDDDTNYNETNANSSAVLDRDVFFDVIIVDGTEKKEILKSDYITPHPSMFENPIPIRILALQPEVKLQFNFLLREKIIAGMNRKQRLDLYKNLILDLGVGAKTNTGYGSLSLVKREEK